MPTVVTGFSKKFDRDKFSELVKLTLEKDPHFHFDVAKTKGEILRLSLIVPPDFSPSSPILLAASLEKNDNLTSSTKAFADIAVLEGRISGSDVSQGIKRVLDNLYLLRSGKLTDNNDYLKRLEQAAYGEVSAPGELINAITVLSDMGEKKAEPLLIKILEKTDSLSLGNACMVALGDLQSEAGMPAIINFVERKPSVIRRQAIIAARKIGSKTAAEWLLVMAYGHDDPVVRNEAMIALEEVEQKLLTHN